jgi:ubiquinone biosynthesis protein
VPRVFWEATTSRVLTLERIRGVEINDLKSLDEQGTDRRWLAQYAANVVLQMVWKTASFMQILTRETFSLSRMARSV